MRPQDVVILFKIITKGSDIWQNKDLANELFIRMAEITTSLERSRIAGLINFDKRKVHKKTLLEFVEYGIHVVFPVIPAGITSGVYTSHSHPFMKEYFMSNEPYVWPFLEAKDRGQSITPLYPNAVKAAIADEGLYKILALIDVIRVGQVRESQIALKEIKRLVHVSSV